MNVLRSSCFVLRDRTSLRPLMRREARGARDVHRSHTRQRKTRNEERRTKNGPALIALFVLASCTSGPQPVDDTASYIEAVVAARAAKDEMFRTASDSPVPPDRRDRFLPLSYFPPDPEYKAPAALQPPAEPSEVVEIPTSTGKIRAMQRVGTLEFSVKGQPLSLTAFAEAGAPPDRLFVPFADLTSGTETYPAGRYMDLDRTATGIYEVDFNRAYHPYCYFDARYDCPFPPAENRLAVAIRAGERLPTAN